MGIDLIHILLLYPKIFGYKGNGYTYKVVNSVKHVFTSFVRKGFCSSIKGLSVKENGLKTKKISGFERKKYKKKKIGRTYTGYVHYP